MAELMCDFFYYSSRQCYNDTIFEEMWRYDKDQFIVILFYLRRHRVHDKTSVIKGRGERKIFYQVIKWMSFNKILELRRLLPYIPDCGYWKDLLVLMGTPAESDVINLFGTQLIKDHYNFVSQTPGLISLASKWTPNEGSSSDKKYKTTSKIAKFMGISKKVLRTQYLVPMRRYLLVTEQLISDKRWPSINYAMIPKLSMELHSKIFQKNDGVRFNDYLDNSHVNYLKHLVLPDLVNVILSNNIKQADVGNNNGDISSSNIFAICVSGSMTGFPVALAACLYAQSAASQWIPFNFEDNTKTSIYAGHECRYIHPSPNNKVISVINSNINVVPKIPPNEQCSNNKLGYNLNICIEIAQNLGKTHIIFVSNTLLDISEFPVKTGIYITYWVLTTNRPTIINIDNLTIIEGYDINIYRELLLGHHISGNSYKEIIVRMLRMESREINLIN